MGGGGGGSHSTEYEPERRGVSKRRYGAVASDGIQSREQYEALKGLQGLVDKSQPGAGGQTRGLAGAVNKVTENFSRHIIESITNKNNLTKGADYDTKWNRWKLGNGVDLESALADWENYESERMEIAQYEAKEARRMAAPDDLAGTKGTVDSTLGIKDDKKDKDKTVGGTSTIVDESPTTASSNQSLGIY